MDTKVQLKLNATDSRLTPFLTVSSEVVVIRGMNCFLEPLFTIVLSTINKQYELINHQHLFKTCKVNFAFTQILYMCICTTYKPKQTNWKLNVYTVAYMYITNILIQLIGPTLTSVWCVHVQVCVIKYHEICISIQVPNLHCCVYVYQKYT